jgi:hypothetical protein
MPPQSRARPPAGACHPNGQAPADYRDFCPNAWFASVRLSHAHPPARPKAVLVPAGRPIGTATAECPMWNFGQRRRLAPELRALRLALFAAVVLLQAGRLGWRRHTTACTLA